MEYLESTGCSSRGIDLQQDTFEPHRLLVASLIDALKFTPNIDMPILQCFTQPMKGDAPWANRMFV